MVVRGPLSEDIAQEELTDKLGSVAGVANTEVEIGGDGKQVVRLFLDGTQSPEDVAKAVEAALKTAPVDPPVAITPARPAEVRRQGLGRGLESLLSPAGVAGTVQRPEPQVQYSTTSTQLALVAIEESAEGIVVRARDTLGRDAVAKVDGTSAGLNYAVTHAVAELAGQASAPEVLAVEVRDHDAASVLTVLLRTATGNQVAGAAVVEAGMPFTLGRAIWVALASE
ncbi:hypothetical protein MNBD_ACTINO02-2130 [hydrothermal vent metagenome]|uniref:Uncharacterized protein n=1 Tax=hydrothermal vent metagenome TaxID=652676 RepID=A0A3B0SER1_9ZZZZ